MQYAFHLGFHCLPSIRYGVSIFGPQGYDLNELGKGSLDDDKHI